MQDKKKNTGGETHLTADNQHPPLTTNHGVHISDNQNSLKSGSRGPVLLEDFVLREKIFHFDHERIQSASCMPAAPVPMDILNCTNR